MQRTVISGVRPTRLELLKLRRRELIAKKGRDILQEKLDALVIENTRIASELASLRASIVTESRAAYKALQLAGVITGWMSLEEMGLGCTKMPEISITNGQVMGVRYPMVHLPEEYGITPHKTRGYSMHGSFGQVDEAARAYENLLERLIRYASVQAKSDRITLEINRTRRRVNALDHLIIPRLVKTQKYIEFRLEEREREDLFRRKRVKQLINREESEREGDLYSPDDKDRSMG